MTTINKYNVLFIQDNNSLLNLKSELFNQLFNKVDFTLEKEEALELFHTNKYDIIIGDITVEPKGVGLLKQIRDQKTEQIIFALVSPKDSEKLYKIADLNIHAFELIPEYFDLALEEISKFDPTKS